MKKSLVIAAMAAIAAGSVAVPMALHEPRAISTDYGPGTQGLTVEEITFDSDGIGLAGQIFAPSRAARVAVAIIHGSGTSRRDNSWYGALVRRLVDLGYVVLLPDKRGSERSGGDWQTASMEDLADDALASVEVLRQRFPALATGIIGVSQGGWVAALAAERDPSLAFAVNLSGATVPPAQQLVLEERNTMHEEMGVPLWAARALAPLTAWNIRTNVQSGFWDMLKGFDPLDHWSHAEIPVMVAYGALDEFDNVPVDASVARLKTIANPAIEVHVYDNVGHGLTDWDSGAFHPDFFPDLQQFITSQSSG